MPVSSTATGTAALPVVHVHARCTPGTPRNRASIALASLPPAGCSHHWPAVPGKNGSLGVVLCSSDSRSLGSTHATSGDARRRVSSASVSAGDSVRPKSSTCEARPVGRTDGEPADAVSGASPVSVTTRCSRSRCSAAASMCALCTLTSRIDSCAGASVSSTIKPRGAAWAAEAVSHASSGGRRIARNTVVLARVAGGAARVIGVVDARATAHPRPLHRSATTDGPCHRACDGMNRKVL